MKQLKWSKPTQKQIILLKDGKAIIGWNDSFGVIMYVPSGKYRYTDDPDKINKVNSMKAELRATHPEIIEKLRSYC